MPKMMVKEAEAPNGTIVSAGRFPDKNAELLAVLLTNNAPLGKGGRALQFAKSRKLSDGRTESRFALKRETAEVLYVVLGQALREYF